MSAPASPTPLRRLLETHFEEMSSQSERLFQESREQVRREFADQLNQTMRRIHQSGGLDELGATMADAAGSFAGGAAWFLVDGAIAQCRAVRGVSEDNSNRWTALEVPLDSAAALRGVIETRDPVVAAASPSELSPELLELTGAAGGERVSIFPVIAGDQAVALIYTWGATEGPVIEMLALAAAGVWSRWTKPPAAELVQIAPAEPAAVSEPASAWEQLPPEEQQVHLRAQRFARVRVAEMRLQDTHAVQSGRTRRNLYSSLQTRIDAARDSFRRSYFDSCPSMVDYLHLELLRTLANDDAELLGADYPGPMV